MYTPLFKNTMFGVFNWRPLIAKCHRFSIVWSSLLVISLIKPGDGCLELITNPPRSVFIKTIGTIRYLVILFLTLFYIGNLQENGDIFMNKGDSLLSSDHVLQRYII